LQTNSTSDKSENLLISISYAADASAYGYPHFDCTFVRPSV